MNVTTQHNYTSPEQSKRLLELGLPTESADCYYDQFSKLGFRCEEDYSYNFFDENFMFIPCWSVGQLIDILKMVTERGFLGVHFDNFMTAENNIESLIHALSLEFPRYKKKQEKADIIKEKQQELNNDKVYHSIETLDFANKMYGDLLPTDDDLVGMQDFLY